MRYCWLLILLCGCGAPTEPTLCDPQTDTVVVGSDTIVVHASVCVSYWKMP